MTGVVPLTMAYRTLLSPVHQKQFILIVLLFLRLENYPNVCFECVRFIRVQFGEGITEI